MTIFNYNPDDDEPPFMLPGDIDRMRLEAKQRMTDKRPLTIQEEIEAALRKPFVPNVSDREPNL
jgi:hypothetical protein